MINKIALILLISTFVLPVICSAYDNYNVHPAINEKALTQSQVGSYLKRQFGFVNGIKEVFDGKAVGEWIRVGATQEDIPDCRSRNHFHDPLKPWDSAGLNNASLNLPCLLLGLEKNRSDSSLIWSQNQSRNPFYDNQWSWSRARQYYYQALTSSSTDTRETRFGAIFRALGQVMHLLADSSVPAHVRNDIHVMPTWLVGQTYESWAMNNWPALDYTAKKVDPAIFSSYVADKLAPVPISTLWDKDVYRVDGSNPEVTWTTDPTISEYGLSEYTNANFFSEDTIFRNYPHPKKENTTAKLVEQYAKDGKLDTVWYVMGYQTERLAALSYFSEVDVEAGWKYHLDAFVYQDYARNLIPRAVGYSAALLDYFFRGDIRLEYDATGSTPGYVVVNKSKENMNGLFQIFYDNKNDQRTEFMSSNFGIKAEGRGDIFTIRHTSDAKEPGKYILVFKGNMGNEKGAVAGYVTSLLLEVTPPEQFIYSMVDAGIANPEFTNIKVKIKNASNETMQNGTIQAIAKYKKTTDDPEFLYSVSTPKTGISLGTVAQEFSFDFTDSPIPVDVTDLYLEIVFKGTIGAEQNAVAIGIKDIREPTPIDLFNNTDRSCLYNKWYVSSSPAAIAQVDKNKDGDANDRNEWDVYPHILRNLYVKISSPENPQQASPTVNNFVLSELDAGQFRRTIYILTEEQFKYSINAVWERKGSNDLWGHSTMTYLHSGTAVRNQTDYTSDPDICGTAPLCYTYTYPGDYSVRGNNMWWGGGIVFIASPYPATSSCQGYE